MVAEITLSSIFFAIGIDSPVIADSSTKEDPSMIFPSTGIESPGFIKTISPFLI